MERGTVRAFGAALALGIALAAASVQAAEANRTIVHAGTLLAVPGEAPLTQQSVLVEDGRITAVRPGFVGAEDAGWDAGATEILNLRDKFVLPGMVDLHVHLSSPVEEGGRLRVVTESSADLALIAAMHARTTLAAGFTTILDIGTGRRAHAEAMFALRDAIAAGKLPGPRLLAVGSPISSTGGAGTGRYRRGVEGVVGPDGECDGADDCRRAVREQIKRGADVINFYNTGSLGDAYVEPQAMTDAEMRAIVETAHSLGRPVVADGHSAAGLNAALRAGADALVAATWPDEETWRLLRETGAYMVPHVYAFEFFRENMGEIPAPEARPPIIRNVLKVINKPYAVERAIKEGVAIAIGSDTGVIHHGENAGDLVEFVKRGMTPARAIHAATVNGAAILRLSDRIGTLEAGKSADLIAVAGNPLEDISELRRVVFVMARGKLYKQ